MQFATDGHRVVDLYHAFRDRLISDCIQLNLLEVELWGLVPEKTIGRLQTFTMIRKMVSFMVKDFPGGISFKTKTRVLFNQDFLTFASTHHELQTPYADVVSAWTALQSIG